MTTPAADGFRMPAEWAPHAATWLAWPEHRTDWPGKKSAIYFTFAEMTRLLTQVERVRLLVKNPLREAHARTVLKDAGVDLNQVDFVTAPTNRSWLRDSLPTFVSRKRDQQVAAVKWRFNGWGRYRDHALDDAAGCAVAKMFTNHYFPTTSGAAQAVAKKQTRQKGKALPASQRIVLEGGAIDTDGLGTLLTTTSCLLEGKYSRNPGLDQAGTEQALRDYLGVKTILWLPDGIAGDDTSGHVDDFARFVAPGQVVVCQEANRHHPNHAPLVRAKAVLLDAKDARGKKLNVVDLPCPKDVTYRGMILPASYANFYVANQLVLVPTFNDPADRLALGILSECFPKRDVVGVYCRDLVLGLGTIHCSTQQEPLGG